MNPVLSMNIKAFCMGCGKPNKCAMEAGKSVSTCWCITETAKPTPEMAEDVAFGGSCYCRDCLRKAET